MVTKISDTPDGMEEGILYALFGNNKKHWKEFYISLKSLRSTNPGIKTCLVTNSTNIPSSVAGSINKVIQLDENSPFSWKLKTLAMINSPFQRTLYLDLDTKVMSNISEIFEFLKLYDIAVAHDPLCDWSKEDYLINYFNKSKFNAGVFAFRKNETMDAFFKIWLQSTIPGRESWDDQDNFNKLILEEKKDEELGLKVLSLPNTVYNAREWIWRTMKKEGIRKRTKIYHAHDLTGSFFASVYKHLMYKMRKR